MKNKEKELISKENKEKILKKLEKDTKTDFIKIKLNPEKEITLSGSKIGGTPYWKNIIDYPKDKNGNLLTLMAQFNLSELPENDKLPNQGLLQFFFLCDDWIGLNNKIPDSNDGFRVIYHSEIDSNIKPLENIPTTDDLDNYYSPIKGTFGIDFSVESESLSIEDYNFLNKFRETAKEFGIDIPKRISLFNIFTDEEWDKIYESDNESASGHKLFGYPFFTQEDPRNYNINLRKYDTLLFQLDSDYENGNDKIMFGDAGICNFFINSKDLIKLDFSKVLYNWDCY